MLWVRTDEFFHNGDYEAIMPMIRLITWLDPHQIDVYETGAWHMDYNFTDSQERADKRYIPLSIALINEGHRQQSRRAGPLRRQSLCALLPQDRRLSQNRPMRFRTAGMSCPIKRKT